MNWVSDLENRGRRKNIRIVGLPEEAEGEDPTQFFETWLPEILHIETKSGRVKLERAHRSLAPKAPSTQRPWPVLVRFHNYQDKCVMNASILRRRKGYDALKKQLRALCADYRQIYPTSLRITCRESTKVFHEPAAVEKYVQSLKESLHDNVWTLLCKVFFFHVEQRISWTFIIICYS